MKNRKRMRLLAVAAFCILALCGCKGGEEDSSKIQGEQLSNKYLVKAGTSEYVVVLPEKPQEKETFAAEEFVYFIEEATGCKLEIVSDEKVSGGSKYISIGQTKQFENACSKADLSVLEDTFSSYYVTSVDDNIYVMSSDDWKGYGSLYGIYDLLSNFIDYTYYHDQEIHFVESDTVNLWEYKDCFVEPSFDKRTHSTAYIYSNELHNTRLRYINFSRGIEWDHSTVGHSQVSVFVRPIDAGKNGAPLGQSHPEWFMDPTATTVGLNENQLCWTAGGDDASKKEMQELVAEKMIVFFQMNPEAYFFMFGQQDNETTCTCKACVKAMEEWAGTSSGLQIDFMNGVIEICEEWLEENMPEREVQYVVYAYKPTEEAPVKKTKNGDYEAYSDRVIPHEELGIFFAPVKLNFAHSMDSMHNIRSYEALKGWNAVTSGDQLLTYTYDLNISYYFVNFYNFGTVASMYRDLEENGVEYLLSQGVSDGNAPCFDEMRSYVISNLMWDVEQNYDDLTADFMQHYYKDAAENMQNLYEMLRDRFAWYFAAEDPGAGVITGITANTTLYPRNFVEKMDDEIRQALEAIEPLKESNSEQYELLKARIMKEYLSNIYIKMSMYKDYYTEEEIGEMKEVWDYYTTYWNLTKGGEGKGLPNIF